MLSESPRNYSLVLLITATGPQFNCKPCAAFGPSYEMAASSWKRSAPAHKNPLYFGLVDYSYGKEVFQKLGIEHAPNVLHLPPTEGPHKKPSTQQDNYQIKTFDPETFVDWVGRMSGSKFQVVKPVDYTPYLVGVGAVLVTGLLGRLLLPSLLPTILKGLQNKTIYQSVCLIFIVHMCSGTMWNAIRGAPYAGRTQDGGMSFIKGEFQAQYQVESQIITGVYALLAALMILMVKRIPEVKDASTQRYLLYFLLGLYIFVYSGLVVMFRMKNGGYPFKILF